MGSIQWTVTQMNFDTIAKRPRVVSLISSEIRNLEKEANNAASVVPTPTPTPVGIKILTKSRFNKVLEFRLETMEEDSRIMAEYSFTKIDLSGSPIPDHCQHWREPKRSSNVNRR
ncbi:hypothetical protein R6Q59_017111 [Mikania micrantha]